MFIEIFFLFYFVWYTVQLFLSFVKVKIYFKCEFNCLHCMCIILDDEDATEENKFIDPVPSDNVKVVIHLIY